jgi:hypothetical protein
MPKVKGIHADHQVYVVPGLIDGDVCRQQAQAKWDKLGETSIVHFHAHEIPCGGQRHNGYGVDNEDIERLSTKVNQQV